MIHKPTFKYMFMSHYATEVCKCPEKIAFSLDLAVVLEDDKLRFCSSILRSNLCHVVLYHKFYQLLE